MCVCVCLCVEFFSVARGDQEEGGYDNEIVKDAWAEAMHQIAEGQFSFLQGTKSD